MADDKSFGKVAPSVAFKNSTKTEECSIDIDDLKGVKIIKNGAAEIYGFQSINFDANDVVRVQENKPDMKAICGEYAESTTIHGIAPIYSANNLYTRVFWLLMFTCALALLSWQIWTMVAKLRRKDVLTTMKSEYHHSIPFPALTLCNANGFMTKFAISELKKGIVEGNITEKEIRGSGIKMEDFLLMKNECSENKCNFTQLTTMALGNCFTMETNVLPTGAGEDYDFFIILDVNVDNYNHGGWSPTFGSGALVIVHSPDDVVTEVLAKNKGTLISPGRSATLRVKKRKIKRLPHPYPDRCFPKKYTDKFLGFSLKKPFKYTTELCETLCYIRNNLGNCSYLPIFDYIDAKRLLSEEEKIFPSNDSCPHPRNTDCDCPPPCEEEVFEVKSSEVLFPSPKYQDSVMQMINENAKNAENLTINYLQINTLVVKVFISDFTVETIEQSPAYNWNSFLSDLGGNMGLWIGASVYSGFELVSIIFKLALHYFQKKEK